MKFKNTDYSTASLQHFKGLGVPNEDFVFKRSPGHMIHQMQITTSPPHDYYKTGVMRIVEYYKAWDLYKIKANWCSKPVWELNP